MTTRVLLADDNSDLRSALRLLLEKRLDESIILEAHDMEQVLAQAEDVHPDCIVLDWELPGRPKRERVQVLRTLVPGIHILVTSARPEAREEALADGADQFAAKSDSPSAILDAIRACCSPRR
jgi:DNA-binding NarL/FixJ family response regulator